MSLTETIGDRITHCADEPIHIPGSIQPHGYLLVLAEPDLTIRQLSGNCEALLGRSAHACLGQTMGHFLTPDSLSNLQRKLAAADLRTVNPIKIQFADAAGIWDAVARRSQGLLLLELESAARDDPSFLDVYRKINTALEDIGAARDLAELYRVTVEHVRDLTGYDRVMIYEFDAEWNGKVVAEVRAPQQEPFLGLHYPASDIPAQARRLYTSNWLRSIPDVHYVPSPILGGENAGGIMLDLSGCSLRSVSPVHIQYLKNMGVGASTSVSVIKNGVLWGLIALHHDQPAYLPLEVRQGLEFVGRIFSLQQAARQKLENLDYKNQLRDLRIQLENRMKQQADFMDGLLRDAPDFTALADGCSGGAILHRGKLTLVGQTPSESDMRALAIWLRDFLDARPFFYTASLVKHYPAAENFKDSAAGLLVISIPEVEPCYLFWFKPEVIQTVDWSGNPRKAKGKSELTPRASFALWQETVRLTALPWQREEIEVAEELRRSIIEVDLENQVRIAMDSNSELDQFASVISHDLKEPLRGIAHFADFLLEDASPCLDSESLSHLQGIRQLATKTRDLISNLYEYSKVGRIDMSFAQVDMNNVLRDVTERLSAYLIEHNVKVNIAGPLPSVLCDSVRVCEVFANLITNAVKYNDRPGKQVHVGANLAGDVPVFFVKDNGIGISPHNQERVFAMFQRLHTEDAYGGGSGIGLAIVKRIIDRHGGRIWLDSTPGAGTTFFFTLRPQA